MSPVCIQDHLITQWSLLSQRVNGLSGENALKPWFLQELLNLQPELQCSFSLNETHARISALGQLDRLLTEHLLLCEAPAAVNRSISLDESYWSRQSRLPAHVLETSRRASFSIAPDLLLDPAADNMTFDAVSPTAKVVNHLRSQDESLRFSAALNFEQEGDAILNEVGIHSALTRAKMGVLFQSRYYALNAALSRQQDSQIVELAAGISPRGLQWSRNRPGTIYVESDLPQLMKWKAKLVRDTIYQQSTPMAGILRCCAADVFDFNSLVQIISTLDSRQPITVVTEGLLLYFSEEEMQTVWSHMTRLMQLFPKITWITDLVSRNNLQDLFAAAPDVAAGVNSVFAKTGRTVVAANPFPEEHSIHSWIESFGLRVESQIALSDWTPRLTPPIPVSQHVRNEIVGRRKIWSLRRASASDHI